jgi:hypothetical protein
MPIGRIAFMAAIVATLLCVPLGTILGALFVGVLDGSVHSFVTFGGSFYPVIGLMLWWLISYVPAFLYAVLVANY